jgi:hypothetical protein
MIVISERVLDWIDRWTRHGGKLGKVIDGGLALEIEEGPADDPVGRDLKDEIQSDPALAEGVARVLILMLQRCGPEDFEND